MNEESNLVVSAEGLTFSFGGRNTGPVLDNLSIHVEQGTIYGLLGPSGCGKTTLLKCIANQHRPSSGTMTVYGKAPGDPDLHIPGPDFGFMPQEIILVPNFTIEEMMTYFGRLYLMEYSDIAERISFLMEFLEIPDQKMLNGNLSGGEQRRVSLAFALIHNPPLLILDEPTVGVDPVLRLKIWNYLTILVEKNGTTIIITTHYIEEARQAHTVGLIRDGKILTEMEPSALMKQHGVLTLEEAFVNVCLIDIPENKQLENVLDSAHEIHDLGRHAGRTTEKQGFYDQWRGTAVRLAAVMFLLGAGFKRSPAWMCSQLLIPVVCNILTCLAVGQEPHRLPVAVVNMETLRFGYGQRLLNFLNAEIIVQKVYPNHDDALRSLKSGDTMGVIYISYNFSKALTDRYLSGQYASDKTIDSSTVKLYLDWTNRQNAYSIYKYLDEAHTEFRKAALRNVFKSPQLLRPLIMEIPVATTGVHSGIYGAIAMTFLCVFINISGTSAVILIVQKNDGLLDRSLCTGMRWWEYVAGNAVIVLLVHIVTSSFVMTLAFLLLGLSCLGSYLSVAWATLLVALEGIAMGVFLSLYFDDVSIATTVNVGTIVPYAFICDVLWPKVALPFYLRTITDFLPLTLIVHTLRSVVFRGDGLTDSAVWRGLLAASVWIVVLFSISAFMMRRKH